MQTFDTPQPISVTINLGLVVGNVRLTASDRSDTTIDVRPIDPSSKNDVRIAEQTTVEYAGGALAVRGPKLSTLFGRKGGIDVVIEVPSGSRLQGETGMGEVRCDGQLGECQFRTGYGEIRVAHADAAKLKSSSGDVTVDQVDGTAEVTASNGAIRVGRVDGPATVKNSNGSSWIGEVTGDLRVNASNGTITIERAGADVTAKTANGNVRIAEVARGTVALETAAGSLEVGIRQGTAAWLDLNTTAGRVRNELTASAGPEDAAETVRIRARTSVGDILIHHS
jgi:DUF4097 and DUF4098 domain-containing protein YvlB